MKQSRPVKKKRSRTWAEAITEALARSSTKVLGVREIHEKIVLYKLKDVQMTKQDEKVLKTMLAQSMNSESCQFYKVRDKPGYYALKDPSLYRRADLDGSDVDSLLDMNEDSNGSGISIKRKSKRKVSSPTVIIAERKSINKKKLLSNKGLSNNAAKRSNSYTESALRKAQLLSRRRTSTPNFMPSFSHASLRTRPQHLQPVHRSRSTNSLHKTQSNPSFNTRRSQIIVDLETPSSVLTNTRLKSIINMATFSMLPLSYQYQLIQLLPEVDRVLDDNGVPRMNPNALNNEFFSQALQDWSTQLSEGEFTRETQARIMQEIAKERSKIAPWKEKFFEEYYGQKQELKRTRSRSLDATANLADLSFEAQLAKFQHLSANTNDVREEQGENEGADDIIMVDSGSESDQDPDYVDNIPLAARFASKDSSKPINRRKINKPFKRTVLTSAGGYRQNTSMIHRKAPSNPLFASFGAATLGHFKSSVRSHPNFQIRDEVYRSDSEASDTGELSDSNSFHQHDDTDEEDDGESSDGMMNLGDNNLMDVDEDSDSEDPDGTNSDCVTTDHSYTRMVDAKARRRSSDDRECRRPSLGKVRTVITSGGKSKSDRSKTLVLRPRGNLAETVKALDESSDSTNTSPEQIYKRLGGDRPSFEKMIPVSKQETSKEERVGVMFSRGLQPAVNTSYGESIIPRISTTSGLLSGPITPTTVITSTTPSRSTQESKNRNMLPIKCHTSSENARTLKSKELATGGSAPGPQNITNIAAVPRTRSGQVIRGAVAPGTAAKSNASLGTGAISQGNTMKTQKPEFGVTPNLWQGGSATDSTAPHVNSPVLTSKPSPLSSPPPKDILKAGSPVLSSPQAGSKRPLPTSSSSPVKKTRTLAEIKAQMKAKRLAASSASPVRGMKPRTPQSVAQKAPVKIAQPVFCPNPTRNVPPKPATSEPPAITTTTFVPLKAETEKCTPVMGGMVQESFVKKGISIKTEIESDKEEEIEKTEEKKPITNTVEPSQKPAGKIILKIKSEEGKKYSIKLDTRKSPALVKNSDSDEGDIIRKTRRLSQVIASSGDSSDDFDGIKDSSIAGVKLKENYAMLTQLALPASYSNKTAVMDHHSLLKRTQKSPVFGEPAFEGLGSISKTVAALPTTSAGNATVEETKSQPFMSDKPVIGFQDIPSCTALSSSSNVPTFAQPSVTGNVTAEAQKYRSTGKGKSLVQMQQLARTNQIPSDDSEQADTDTEDDSTASNTSSTEDDAMNSVHQHMGVVNGPQLRKRNAPNKSGKVLENGPSSGKQVTVRKDSTDCEDSYSSSSGDDKPVITECICSCKRLVLCKGCGAYTHEECLSSTKLCSLCV